ncbi:MAG: beta(1,3)galactosyltransferase EpsH [Bacteroides thetaiotaomicron]|nr:beta(1,3)galactosyltransferase EpsH [Bacteroides thetaiotaomicron]
MIFVAVGTQKFQMNRLLMEVDNLISAGKIDVNVYAQSGNSTYKPTGYSYAPFLTKDEFDEKIDECELLITHGGVGTIVSGLKRNKAIIVVPRLKKYKEHVDDHQLQIADSFAKLGYILKCEEMEDLAVMIEKANSYQFSAYKSERSKMLEYLDGYIANTD